MPKLSVYKVIFNQKNKKAYIEDEEGIRYIQFLPHPDGDPWMTLEGIDIILDLLKITPVEGKRWTEIDSGWELEINIGE